MKIFELLKLDEAIVDADSNYYDQLMNKHFGELSPTVTAMAASTRRHLENMGYKLVTKQTESGKFVVQYFDTGSEILLIGILTASGRIAKNDYADIQEFVDLLFDELKSGKTLMTTPHDNSFKMLKHIQRQAQHMGIDFEVKVTSDIMDFNEPGGDDPRLRFRQVNAWIDNRQQLSETGDNIVNHDWVMNNDYDGVAQFKVDEKNYIVNFSKIDDKNWHLSFALDDPTDDLNFGITSSGNAFAVFATVVNIIKEFRKIHSGVNLIFTAAEESRKRLYKSMLTRFLNRENIASDHQDVTTRNGNQLLKFTIYGNGNKPRLKLNRGSKEFRI